jgi:hypothetical protein
LEDVEVCVADLVSAAMCKLLFWFLSAGGSEDVRDLVLLVNQFQLEVQVVKLFLLLL